MFSVKSVSFAALALLFVSGVSAAPTRNAEIAVREFLEYEDLHVLRRGYENVDAVVVAREAEPEAFVAPVAERDVEIAERKAEPEAVAEPFNRAPKIPVGTLINKRAVAVEVASKTDENGNIVPYKREVAVEVASKTDENGNIVPYKREVAVEVASKTDENGNIVPYKREVAVEVASKTDENGNIVPYKRSDENVKVAKRNVLKLSSAGPARRSNRLYKRGKAPVSF